MTKKEIVKVISEKMELTHLKTKEIVQVPDMPGMEVQIVEADDRKVCRLRIVNVTGAEEPTELKEQVS